MFKTWSKPISSVKHSLRLNILFFSTYRLDTDYLEFNFPHFVVIGDQSCKCRILTLYDSHFLNSIVVGKSLLVEAVSGVSVLIVHPDILIIIFTDKCS